MRKRIITSLLFVTTVSLNSQVISVFPSQNKVGATKNTQIFVELNEDINPFVFNVNTLFRVDGSNSGLVKGTVEVDTNNNKFIFIPYNSFYSGEIINVSFGLLRDGNISYYIDFHWRFTIEITKPSEAKFDSLQRFPYPSTDAVTIDYDDDGDIDIVSATGRIIYNDGTGNYNSYDEIQELIGLKYLIDVNNDAILDIVTSYEGIVKIFIGNGSGAYILNQTIYPYNQKGGSIIARGDINGDGFLDLISTETYSELNNNWRIFLNDGAGMFLRDTNTTYLKNWITEADLVDMDRDGTLDLVLLNTWPINPITQFDGAYIYYNDGLGNFVDSTLTRFYICPYNISLSDLRQLFVLDYNQDGLNDIVAFGSQNGGLIIFQDSNKTFCGFAGSHFGAAENFAFFTSGDINGDDRLDIMVSNLQVCPECGDTGMVSMATFLNFNPINFGSDSSRSNFDLGIRNTVGAAVVPTLADIDNDGDLDVIHTGYPTTITYNNNLVNRIQEQTNFENSFILWQNYPNPFNPTTTISYALPFESDVTVLVYDLTGSVIKTYNLSNQSAGYNDILWDGRNDYGEAVTSGVYICLLKAKSLEGNGASSIKSTKLMLLK